MSYKEVSDTDETEDEDLLDVDTAVQEEQESVQTIEKVMNFRRGKKGGEKYICILLTHAQVISPTLEGDVAITKKKSNLSIKYTTCIQVSIKHTTRIQVKALNLPPDSDGGKQKPGLTTSAFQPSVGSPYYIQI